MPTVTIRNLPEPVVERLRHISAAKGHSMEQELRDLVVSRYASRIDVLKRVRSRWKDLPATSPAEIDRWRNEGRP